MALCGYKNQIQLLSSLSSFEVDMSYKRIRGKDINEVLFATFLPDQCKSKIYNPGLSTPQPRTNCLATSYYIATGFYK